MLESPDAVLLYIPLMKGIGMSWSEIKNTPNFELRMVLAAYHEHEALHSMDGYSDKDITDMAKGKPEIRSQYIQYLEKQRKYKKMIGQDNDRKSLRGIV
jgi:hypothetical protein|tara:strand:+ start:345 stop:641 length:297 start_codon:yes stop_codon:yes gene_type:complete